MASAQAVEEEGRVYGGLSPGERTERRREAFLEAGLEVFGTTGFRSATVRGICKQAGLTSRYFYESFENMEALLAAVFEACIDDLRRRVALAFSAPGLARDPDTMVMTGLECFFDWVEDPRVARVCWREVVGVSRALDKESKQALRGFAPVLLGLTREVFPDWEIDEAEAEVLAVAATGAFSQAALRWHQEGQSIPRATMIAALSRLLRGIGLTIQADLARAAGRGARRRATRRRARPGSS